jgi:hypothetical protein
MGHGWLVRRDHTLVLVSGCRVAWVAAVPNRKVASAKPVDTRHDNIRALRVQSLGLRVYVNADIFIRYRTEIPKVKLTELTTIHTRLSMRTDS